MNSNEFWTQALLSALCRLSLREALVEADAALVAAEARHAAIAPLPQQHPGWVANILKGWPTPEDMKRVVRTDGTEFIF
ncbi:hypothetical protein [Luteimonas sp. TWI1416]|uniref:hypothetical protein n=1 Tax=unclassified Luteimonas TaxID=2629088 RepID=UPI00320B5B87